MLAYVWRTGLIEFDDDMPQGAICISQHVTQSVRDLIDDRARHASNADMFVPGVLEADDGDAKVDALLSFYVALHDTLDNRKTAEVV